MGDILTAAFNRDVLCILYEERADILESCIVGQRLLDL